MEDPSLRQSSQQVMDQTENAFGDDEIEAMFAEFARVAVGGKLKKDDFVGVLSKLFEDPEDDKVSTVLGNGLLLDRMYAWASRDSTDGLVSHVALANAVSTMFGNPDSEEHVRFKFHVFDADNKGYFTVENIVGVCRAHLESELRVRGAGREGEALAAFEKGKALVLGEEGTAKLTELAGYALQAASPAQPDRVTLKEFLRAYPPNQEMFDWADLVDDCLADLEAELEGCFD